MKVLIFTATLLFSLLLQAKNPQTYLCAGKNAVNGEGVLFDITFSEWEQDQFQSQIITVVRQGRVERKVPLTLQRVGATPENECETNRFGEVIMSGKFEMNTQVSSSEEPITVSFESMCYTGIELQVTGLCFPEE